MVILSPISLTRLTITHDLYQCNSSLHQEFFKFSLYPFHKDNNRTEVEVTLFQHNLVLTNYIPKDPISK